MRVYVWVGECVGVCVGELPCALPENSYLPREGQLSLSSSLARRQICYSESLE